MYPDEDLLFGSLVHEVLPLMWKDGGGDIDGEIHARKVRLEAELLGNPHWEELLVPEARLARAAEWGRLFEGVCYGIRRVVLPLLKRQYTLVMAEGDALRKVDQDAGLVAKPDTILYGKSSAALCADNLDYPGDEGYPGIGYLEWKTTASANDAWFRQWVKNPQAWTGAMALKAALGVELEWFQVCGLVKGVDRDGRRSSPWCWIYRGPELSKVSNAWVKGGYAWNAEYTNAKGWERVPTSAYPGGVKALALEEYSEEVVAEQFVLTTPDDIDWELAEEWLENQQGLVQAAQAWKIAVEDGEATEELKRTLFPRSLEKCHVGAFGKPCGLRRLCFDPDVQAEPLMYYKQRVPHHQLEGDCK